MRRHLLLIFVIAFILTRLLNIFLAFQPLSLESSVVDLQKYETWGVAAIERPLTAYSTEDLEYPPGILPFLGFARSMTPPGGSFVQSYAWVMLLLDIAAFIGVLLLWKRWGSWWGPAVWIVAVPLLGPIVYLRLDLIPTTAVVWAAVAAAGGWWGWSGAALGFGAIAKVYPAFLLFPAFETSPRFRRLLLGAVAGGAIFMIPFVFSGDLPALLTDVAGYHSDRGIQTESTWASFLLLASKFGYPMHLNFQFGSLEAISSLSSVLKTIGLLLSVAALGTAWFITASRVNHGDVAKMTIINFGLLAGVIFFGTVYSPQFTLWLIGAAAVALCIPVTPAFRNVLLLVLPITLLTRVVFPHLYPDLVDPYFGDTAGTAHLVAIVTLILRNLLVGAAALGIFYLLLRRAPVEEDGYSSGSPSKVVDGSA